MKYITNLCTSYGHHMLLLLLFVLFSLQSYVLIPTSHLQKKQPQKTKESEKLTVFLYTDEHTDRHLLHAIHFNRGGRNWLCTIDPNEMKCNLSTSISIFLSLLDIIMLSPLFVQDSCKISSSYRHHHNLSSLDNNKKGILYTSFQMCH